MNESQKRSTRSRRFEQVHCLSSVRVNTNTELSMRMAHEGEIYFDPLTFFSSLFAYFYASFYCEPLERLVAKNYSDRVIKM